MADEQSKEPSAGAEVGGAGQQDEQGSSATPSAPAMMAKKKRPGRRRRCSVSAEADMPTGPSVEIQIKVVPKTEEEMERIRKSVEENFLFASLDEGQKRQVFGAMEEKNVASGDVIIQQGDTGDYFYVLDSGEAEVFVNDSKVFTYHDGSSFGELALMYNCPRAATVKASKDSTLWMLERALFRHIIMENQSKKRLEYESFVKQCPLFKQLQDYEITRIADALQEVRFQDGEVVIKEGDDDFSKMKFYILIKGTALATLVTEGETRTVGKISEPGEFFGEKALIEKAPRAATVTVSGGQELVCACLDVAAFERLLGPCRNIMLRHIGTYSMNSIEVDELPSGSGVNAARALATSGSSSSLVVDKEGEEEEKAAPAEAEDHSDQAQEADAQASEEGEKSC